MPKTILIAEDDKMLLQTMAYFLKKKGYEVLLAEDGESAADKIRNKKLDAIVTDINMPYVGGMEITHLVKTELKLDIPVIILTSSGLEKTQLDAFTIGASEFITKPFSLPVLAARIEKLIGAPNN